MSAKIIPKKSTVASKVPLASDLEPGEICINLTDGIVYGKHTDGSIVNLTGALELHTHTISQVDGLQSAIDDANEIWVGSTAPTPSEYQFWLNTTDDTLQYHDGAAWIEISGSGGGGLSVFSSFAGFPATGESGKLYIADDTEYMYRWDGTSYIQLTSELFTPTEKTKLSGIESGAQVNTVTSVNTYTGDVSLLKADVGLGQVRNVASYSQTEADSTFAPISHTHNYDNYGGWTLNTDGVSRGNIASGEAVDFVGGTNVSLAYNATGNVITVSSTDTDTTYAAGTGLTLTGTTFSLTDEAYTTTEKSKLAGIESGATGDQTASEIKTAYESNLDTNAFTDALQSKLNGIEAGADAYGSWTISDGVNSESILSGGTLTVSGTGATSATYDSVSNTLTINSTDTDTDTTYTAGTGISLTGTTFSLTDEPYTTTEKNKLAGIETGATGDQTASEILTAIKTVDGTTSGLDADLLDGNHASAFALDSSISTVGKTGSYNDLTNKPDLSSLEDVQVFASTAGFPATGTSGVVYIAEDTGYMYRWNGTSYTQMTDQTAIWGQISGTLSNQTDLQNALNAKLDSASAYTSTDFDTDFGTKSTTDLSEGTNLYYTNARARAAISVSGDLSYSSATGVISFSETYSTASEIKTAYESNLDTNAYTDSEKTKLSGIESGATGDQTASEILTAIKTVDGSTSGLDADLLDGNHASAFALAGHTHNYDNYGGWTLNTDGVSRGNIASGEGVDFVGGTNVSLAYNATGNVITISSTDTNTDTTYTAGTGLTLTGTSFALTDESYTTTEKNKLAGIESGATGDQTASEILTALKTVDGSGSGLDADTLDGINSSSFVRDTGDTLTGTYTINTTDDGVNDLQVGGTSRFQGNVGFGDSSPDEKVDVAGNARIQNENAMKFGGTGAADAQYAIQYNAATKSLDFNFVGA